jgi:hypothetical protein
MIPYPFTRIAPSFAVIKDGLSVKAPVGLGSLEIQVDGQYVSHVEFPFFGGHNQPPPQEYVLTTQHLGSLAKVDPTKRKVTLTAVGTDQRQAELEDYSELCRTSRMVINISEEGPAAPIPTSSANHKFRFGLNKLGRRHVRGQRACSPYANGFADNGGGQRYQCRIGEAAKSEIPGSLQFAQG